MSKSTILFSNERLFDLVRYCRAELHEADLINNEEYAAIAADKGSVDRIQAYDDIRAQLATLTRERDELAAHCQLLRREASHALRYNEWTALSSEMKLANITNILSYALKSTPADSLKAVVGPTIAFLKRMPQWTLIKADKIAIEQEIDRLKKLII